VARFAAAHPPSLARLLAPQATNTRIDQAPVDVERVDDLADVIEDAAWKSGPAVSNPALNAERSGDELHVSGSLTPGQVVTVTYRVEATVKGTARSATCGTPARTGSARPARRPAPCRASRDRADWSRPVLR
jgi:hypothetical protein